MDAAGDAGRVTAEQHGCQAADERAISFLFQLTRPGIHKEDYLWGQNWAF